jgi:hypothetical protein
MTKGNVQLPIVQLTLNANAVAAPVHTAAVTCREIVDFNFDAMSKTDLSKKPPGIKGAFFRFNIRGPDMSAAERQALYESWILAKAFQDLMRGARASLDQAFLFIELISRPVHRVGSASTIDDLTAPLLKRAANKNFPNLLEVVNSKLQSPLEFADAYLSMQAARNCLEHREGIVGRSDINQHGIMELRFPRIRLFYERRGEEIEVEGPGRVDSEDGAAEVALLMRLDIRLRRYELGQRLTLTVTDFDEIAFACYHFGSELATRLPALAPSA